MIRFESKTDEAQFLKANGDIWFWSPYRISNPRTISAPVKFKPEGLAGKVYQVILFKKSLNKINDIDNFECVLIDPIYYIMSVKENSYYGLVGRQFESSPYSSLLEEAKNNPNLYWNKRCDSVFHDAQEWKVKPP